MTLDKEHSRLVVARLAEGLRNQWYAVSPSWMLGSAPLGITRLGKRIALWRDADGAVHAVDDRCPHRGARLSQGWNLGSRLACGYHGVQVDGEGVVVSVPAIENPRMVGHKCNIAYSVVERAGAIFMWFGDPVDKAPDPLVLPEEIQGGEWADILCTAHWHCNYRFALDNVMDPMHGAYLHAVSHSMASGDKTATMEVRDTEHGFVFAKTNQTGVNFDWTEFGATGVYWMRLEIPYGKSAGPGGAFTIVGMVTPVDEHSCRVFFWRCRRVSGWQRDAWKFLYRTRLEKLHWDVLEQDREILEGMAGNVGREMLYAHDAGLVRLRKMMRREAENQISEGPASSANPAA